MSAQDNGRSTSPYVEYEDDLPESLPLLATSPVNESDTDKRDKIGDSTLSRADRFRGWVARSYVKVQESLNGTPPVLLVMFALQAWMQTFPLVAYSGWLYKDLHLTNPQLNQYDSLSFLPYCFKPLYAYVSDKLPIKGDHRKPYIRGCAIVSALCYILTATVIKTPNGAFAITFIRTLVNSAMELFFGLILADHACRNPANSGAIQAAAFGARNLGSVVAYAAGLAIFPPSGGQTVSNAHGIGITAIFPLIIFVLCTWLPNSKLPAADRIGRGEVSVFPVLWMMPLLIWGQLSDGSFSIPPDVWWKVMVALSVVTLGAPLIGARVYYGGFAAVQEAAFNQPLSFFIAAYVFLFNAAPGDAASVAEYQYDAFENNEYYSQYMGIVQFAASFVMCLLYGFLLNGRRTVTVLSVCVVLAGLSKLAFLWFIQYRAEHPDDLKGLFGVLVGVLIVKQAGSELSLVAALTLVTQFTDAAGSPGILYAIYLSCFDLGDVASAQLSTQMGYATIGKTAYSTPGALSNSNLAAIVKAASASKTLGVVFVLLVLAQSAVALRRGGAEIDNHGGLNDEEVLLREDDRKSEIGSREF